MAPSGSVLFSVKKNPYFSDLGQLNVYEVYPIV